MKLLTFALLSTTLFPSLQAEPLPPVQLEQSTIEGLEISASSIGQHLVVDPVNATARIIIDPTRTRSIASFFSGQIENDLVQPGQTVKAGDTLALLKSREVAEVISSFIEADSKLSTASLLYERERKLLPEKLTTEDDFLAAKASYQAALSNRTASMTTALLARTREDLLILREGDGIHNLTDLPVIAPSPGTVIQKSAYAGDAVEKNTQLFELADLDQLLVEVQIPLKAASFVKPGDQLEFHTMIGSRCSGTAKVSRIEPVADQAAYSVTGFATLDNTDRQWLAGTPVNISIVDSNAQKVTAVPSPAIVSIGGSPHLFLEQAAGKYQPVPIKTGQSSQAFTEITGGLPGNARAVVTGASLLLAAWEELTAE